MKFKLSSFFSRKEISFFLKENQIALSKMRGQNFLIDPNTLRKMTSFLPEETIDLLIEIGPGLGHFSSFLLEKISFKKLLMIEIDRKFSVFLKNQYQDHLLREKILIYNQDYLSFSYKDFLALEENLQSKVPNIVIVGNLPYSISGKIFRNFIQNASFIKKSFILIQKELALRICAGPENKKDYGFLSVLMQIFTKPKYLCDVSREVFFPKPKVDSVFLSLDFENNFLDKIENLDFFLDFIKYLFLFRRKRISKLLKNYFQKNKSIQSWNHPFLERRIEELSIEEMISFIKLLERYVKIK